MNSESRNNKYDIRHIRLPSLWEVSIVFLLFYSFFFQYVFKPINGAMIVLNGICIIIGFWNLFKVHHYKVHTSYTIIIAFVVFSVIASIVFGVSPSMSKELGFRMIEYCFTGFSILFFSLTHKHRFIRIFFYIWFFILLFGIQILFKGYSATYSGAVGFEGLNTNEISSFFIFMIFCAFYLYSKANNRFNKTVIIISIIFIFFVQIQTASRRGFIVMLLMIVANLIVAVIPFSYSNTPNRKLIAYSILLIVSAFAFLALRDYIVNNTALGERLVGNMTGGDFARERYHRFALEQFLSHPIIGIGVGGIEYLQGVYSHSLYYETLSCTGLFGTTILGVGLLWPVVILCKRITNSHLSNRTNSYCCRILLMYMICILISGFAVVMIYDFYFYLSLALITAGLIITDTTG